MVRWMQLRFGSLMFRVEAGSSGWTRLGGAVSSLTSRIPFRVTGSRDRKIREDRDKGP